MADADPYPLDDLRSWRRGPAIGDPTPGLDVGPPDLKPEPARHPAAAPTKPTKPTKPHPAAAEQSEPWRCQNPYCLRKGRWWRSVHGVVRCLNCRPPAVPELVAETGEDTAP